MERYIFLLSNGTSFVNFDAILRKLQLFSDGRLEEKTLYSATLNEHKFNNISGELTQNTNNEHGGLHHKTEITDKQC